MKVLITGGNGFLGSALAERFYHSENNIYILVREKSNLKRLLSSDTKHNIIKYSNEIQLSNIIEQVRPDVIINTICNYGRGNESIATIIDSNYRIGMLLLNQIAIIKYPVLFINIGTALDESVSLYSFSKHQFSSLGKFVSKNFSFITFKNVILQHIYGAGDDETKFTSYIINSCLRNQSYINLTLGDQSRDFIYIKDVVNAIFMIFSNIEKINSYDIEVGSGKLVTIKYFVNKVHNLTNSKTKLNFGVIPYKGDEFQVAPANLQVMSNLGWTPLYTLEDALIDILKIEHL